VIMVFGGALIFRPVSNGTANKTINQ